MIQPSRGDGYNFKHAFLSFSHHSQINNMRFHLETKMQFMKLILDDCSPIWRDMISSWKLTASMARAFAQKWRKTMVFSMLWSQQFPFVHFREKVNTFVPMLIRQVDLWKLTQSSVRYSLFIQLHAYLLLTYIFLIETPLLRICSSNMYYN